MCFAENFFRQDLSPVELAASIMDVIQAGMCTVDELAAALRHHPDWVRRQVAMCEWPSDVLEAVHNRKLSVSAAANLACVRDGEYRLFLVRHAVEDGATARTTAAWLQAWEAMRPAEEAVLAEPVAGAEPGAPMVPQAPCISCGTVFRTDELSHVPVCAGCVRRIQGAGGRP